MRIYKVSLGYFRSVSEQQFEVGPFTVLFGKNNSGKTNLLEAMYGVLAPEELPEGKTPARGLRGHGDPDIATSGAVYVDLEPGVPFDDSVLAIVQQMDPVTQDDVLSPCVLPPGQVCFTSTDRGSELWFVDAAAYLEQSGGSWRLAKIEGDAYELDERYRSSDSRLRPLFLGWEFDDIDLYVTSAVAELTGIDSSWMAPTAWLDNPKEINFDDRRDRTTSWRLSPTICDRLSQLESLATSLLPDFIDGSITAEFEMPSQWNSSANVRISFKERGDTEGHSLRDFGRGASRWLSIAVQVALRIMDGDAEIKSAAFAAAKPFSGHVLFVDEPEAHLHPSAVASVVRWCQRMVKCGFTIVAASHHEEFLRITHDNVMFVKVTRKNGSNHTVARAVANAATPVLQELAEEVGMHPATALSLHRAILFVEGPLDQAMLDEYAGPELDAAGVTIIPIHGTRNLEGLIDGEFTARLGIRIGVLTDATVTSTIWERSGKKRSGEEKKLLKLIKRFEDQGLRPPALFGIAEDDMLFALPTESLETLVEGPFPTWHALREECREFEGAGKSDSVNWKAYAETHYGLPITSDAGVREVVRRLDLAGVELPSIRTIVDEIIDWAEATDPSA